LKKLFSLSKNANASDLRLQDITAISSKKQDGNWVIELLVKEEINPALGLNSSNGRIAAIATREQIIAELAGNGVYGNPADVTLRYYNGFASITVNSQGQVLSATNGFQVDAQANNVTISILRGDLTAAQNSEWQYTNFDWTFVPALKWWQRLPSFLQWILRWLCFGWIWM